MKGTANFKILLLVIAIAIVVGMLFYSQNMINRLLAKEREVVDLYARSLEYLASEQSSAGDISFVFDEIVRAIDFPMVLTDAQNNPIQPLRASARNVSIDTSLSHEDQTALLRDIIRSLDEQNAPLRVALQDTIVLNYLHYGESDLIRRLRLMPYIQFALAGLFIVVAYVGFSYIKRNEQSNIWVGMSKETAHQLGTPLSSMMGWLELAREHAAGNPQLSETVVEMGNDIERLNKVAARFSKIGSRPDLKQENVREVIQGVIDYMSRRISRTRKVIDLAIVTPGDFYAQINRELFEWVIENLMKNALDAMETPTGRISFRLEQAGKTTTIDVSDTGKGIDPKFHKDVFRPGYSTKKRGWGLGLSLSKRIIEDYHRGKLFLKQSAVGAGTTFRIRLRL
ncbi:MAG: HAMP domain-containing histidine kinase [Ignavibacteriae bacterium]|nr:HAMP domain-containing histidine kinase [Ignavibacteriota bacterium]